MFITIAATEPSSAMRNAAELKETILKKYGTVEFIPPIIILYTEGGPDHRTDFLSVKIAITVLYHSLNADMLLYLRTAPPRSFVQESTRVNCILNLGLYGMGVIRQKVHPEPEFEDRLVSVKI